LSTSTPLYTSASKFVLQTTRDVRAEAARPDLVTSSIDPTGRVTKFGYDAAGDQTSVTTPEGRQTTRAYNARGEVISVVAPAGNAPAAHPARFTTTYSYDAAGRLLATSVADGPRQLVTKRTYDADGRELSLTDPAGRITSWIYDLAGEIVETKFPGGTDQRTTYWPDGVVRTQVDSAGHIVRYGEDSLGRVVSRTDALGRTTS